MVGCSNSITAGSVVDGRSKEEVYWTNTRLRDRFQRGGDCGIIRWFNTPSNEKCTCCNGILHRLRRNVGMGGNRKLKAKILDATDGIGESRKRKRFFEILKRR